MYKPARTTSELVAIRQAIVEQLTMSLQAAHTQAMTVGPDYADLIAQIQLLLLRGGKRLRPTLTVLSYQAFGGKNDAAIIQAATSQELFHAAILMHDDIIDHDVQRWGGLNISGHYEAMFTKNRPHTARHLADSWALLAGDATINLSFQLLTDSNFSPSKRLAGLRLIQKTFSTMLGGELLDVTASLHTLPDMPSVEMLLSICDYKTARYTFSTPLVLGALLAGAPRKQQLILEGLGRQLGIAYQLQDDLLGMFGEEIQMGKSVLSDLREGKLTVLIHYAVQHATSVEVRILTKLLGKPNADVTDLKQVQSILIRSGAQRYVKTCINTYFSQADDLLRSVKWEKSYTDQLRSLFDQLLQRNH